MTIELYRVQGLISSHVSNAAANQALHCQNGGNFPEVPNSPDGGHMSPRCYIPAFLEICQLVPGKKNFKMFFTIYAHGGHLGHVTSIMAIHFHFLVPKTVHAKLC